MSDQTVEHPKGYDTNGVKYATVSDTKVGSRLRADDGFSCIDKDVILEVFETNSGLAVPCCNGDGHHMLDGQIEQVDDDRTNDFYIGLYPA